MPAKLPLDVSVLIDTYNHEHFIERAITSVLEQDYPMDRVEVLVVDDGSTDRTPEIVRRFEPRVRLIRKSNGGQASAFNVGIPECQGNIIAFLDGDDWWKPTKLRFVTDAMISDPLVGIIGHAIIETFEDGSERVIALETPVHSRLNSVRAAEAFRLHRCYFGTSRMTIRAELAKRILPVPTDLVFEADEFIFTLANAVSDSVILAEPLTHYRVHRGNLFLNSGGSSDGETRKLRVLTCLASELPKSLATCGLPDEISRPIIEMVQAEATQLRLKLEGGSRWQAYRIEGTIYRIQHADASLLQKSFHELMMLPALTLPPRIFYTLRRWLTTRPWYRQMRERFIPVPGFTHIRADEPPLGKDGRGLS